MVSVLGIAQVLEGANRDGGRLGERIGREYGVHCVQRHCFNRGQIIGHAAEFGSQHPVAADVEEAIARTLASQDDTRFQFALSLP